MRLRTTFSDQLVQASKGNPHASGNFSPLRISTLLLLLFRLPPLRGGALSSCGLLANSLTRDAESRTVERRLAKSTYLNRWMRSFSEEKGFVERGRKRG